MLKNILTALVLSGIAAGSAAIVKVNILEARYETDMVWIKQTLKIVRYHVEQDKSRCK